MNAKRNSLKEINVANTASWRWAKLGQRTAGVSYELFIPTGFSLEKKKFYLAAPGLSCGMQDL